jgi:hypothetical protein
MWLGFVLMLICKFGENYIVRISSMFKTEKEDESMNRKCVKEV